MENEPRNPDLGMPPVSVPEVGPAPDPVVGAPMAEPEPAVEPTPVPSMEPMAEPMTSPMGMPEPTQKKSKLGLIITLVIVGVLLIGGAVFGLVWAQAQTKPENVVMGGLHNAIKSKAARVTGVLSMSGDALEEVGIARISIEGKGENSVLPSSSEITIKVVTTDEDTFEIKASDIILADGVLYLKLDGLMETIEKVIPEEMEEFVEYLGEVLEEVEGTWWKLDIADFDFPAEVTGVYDCAVKTLVSLSLDPAKDELIGLYKDWPLLDVEKAGRKQESYEGYNVSLNTTNTVGFVNNLRGTNFYKDFASCMQAVDTSFTDFEDLAEDVMKLPENMPVFTMFINPWSHQMKSIEMSYESVDEDAKIVVTGGLTFEFLDTVNISAPEDAKPVMELFENVMVKICSLMEAEDEECIGTVMEMLMGLFGEDYDLGGELPD